MDFSKFSGDQAPQVVVSGPEAVVNADSANVTEVTVDKVKSGGNAVDQGVVVCLMQAAARLSTGACEGRDDLAAVRRVPGSGAGSPAWHRSQSSRLTKRRTSAPRWRNRAAAQWRTASGGAQ